MVVISHQKENGKIGRNDSRVVEYFQHHVILMLLPVIANIAYHENRVDTWLFGKEVFQGFRYFHHRAFSFVVTEVHVRDNGETGRRQGGIPFLIDRLLRIGFRRLLLCEKRTCHSDGYDT